MFANQSSSARLTDFLRAHGAKLHPNVRIAEDTSSGLHWRAEKDIEPESIIVSVPHSLSLSYLNALVDESWPFFKEHANCFEVDHEVEAISYIYLMVQYVNRETSFWKPYLDALPGPDIEHTQPLFFEDPQDVAWLEGTDVWYSNVERIKRYRSMYENGMGWLKKVSVKHGFDATPYTWELFKWAVSIFTSRSFSSRSLQQHDSKYWAAYRHGIDRPSQVILLDKRGPTKLSDFPVLFPGLDIGNHHPKARIDYIFDPGRFDIKTHDATKAGEEVWNNYGPKGNDELFLGYGFCIPNNPHTTVSLKLKAPHPHLEQQLKGRLPGYFKDDSWNAEAATFKLTRPESCGSPEDVFQCLPEGLLELLTYSIRFARGHTFAVIENPRQYLAGADGSRYLPQIAYTLVQSLANKLGVLQRAELPTKPQNPRQRQAAVYRQDLAVTLASIIVPLQAYLDSLVVFDPPNVANGRCLVSLEVFLDLLRHIDRLPHGFLEGVEANANTRDMETLRAAGWEQDLWVLLLTAHVLHTSNLEPRWLPCYVKIDSGMLEEKVQEVEDVPSHPAHDLMEIVQNAKEACSDSIWDFQGWNAKLIGEMGKVLEFDSVIITSPKATDSNGQPEPRLYVYLHDTKEMGELTR